MHRQRRDQPSHLKCLSVLALFLALNSFTVQVAQCDPISSQSLSQQGAKDLAQLNLKTPEGKTIPEDAEYDESKEVATMRGLDGSFLVHDFEKGLRIVKDKDTGVCYVTPVSIDKSVAVKLEKFLKGYGGQEIQTSEYTDYRAIILPGAIEDTSFLPEETEKECKEYRWMTILGEASDMDGCPLKGQTWSGGEVVTISDLTLPLDHVASSRYKRQVQATVDLKLAPKLEVSVGLKITFGRRKKN